MDVILITTPVMIMTPLRIAISIANEKNISHRFSRALIPGLRVSECGTDKQKNWQSGLKALIINRLELNPLFVPAGCIILQPVWLATAGCL